MKKTMFTAFGFALLATSTALATPQMFGPDTKVGKSAQLPALTGEMRRTYAQFRRDANYFAAMAVNYDTKTAFYIQNFHDLNRVKVAALEGCRQIAQTEGCQIYAVAVPKSLPIDQSTASGLSMLAEEDYKNCYEKCAEPGTYGAFAISGASHHGYSYGWESKADAISTAISYCEVYVAKDMAELGPQARKFAKARNWQTCKVVEVTFTPAN